MVGVTSVNLGGIEVDVEDVADRLRRLKVWSTRMRLTVGAGDYPVECGIYAWSGEFLALSV